MSRSPDHTFGGEILRFLVFLAATLATCALATLIAG
jgi:hypothetical protein